MLTSCVQAPVIPPRTQLEMREMQTRTYRSKDTRMVMKALLNALQDDGYIIKSADRELGFITASKEVNVEDSTEAMMVQIFGGEHGRYKKNSIIEASANVSEFGRETKVRVVFQTKTIDNFGAPLDASQVYSEKFYQDFFSSVDKSLFFERERL
jgi:hypothetical protein